MRRLMTKLTSDRIASLYEPVSSSSSAGFSREFADELHQREPPDRWCVTLLDLKYLRRHVSLALDRGFINPTEEDPFDPDDRHIGPSIYTLVEQYVKPVSYDAGGMSWALMRHPAGLLCDVFVTHAWKEGTFEFLNKLICAWPFSARHAWCCMLSIPQHLDIASLVRSPRSSPFAQALARSRMMLVVPNRQSSIYTRLWCTYEAYLAYDQGKLILTTRTFEWLDIFYVICEISFAYAIGISLAYLFPMGLVPGLWYFPLIASVVTRGRFKRVSHFVGAAGATYNLTCSAFGLGYAFAMIHNIIVCHLGNLAVVFFFLAAIDRERFRWMQRESTLLQNGFTGSIADAECSQPSDEASIRREVGDQVQAVDCAVAVLLRSGMSSPNLREAAMHGVDVTGAGFYSISIFFMATSSAIVTTIYIQDELGPPTRLDTWFAHLAAAVFIILWLSTSNDKKSFASVILIKLIMVFAGVVSVVRNIRHVLDVPPFVGKERLEIFHIRFLSVVWVLGIIACLMGPGGTARMFGRCMTQCLYLGAAGSFRQICCNRMFTPEIRCPCSDRQGDDQSNSGSDTDL